jgi:glycosyltransferase involved in cell wall biosynthesis
LSGTGPRRVTVFTTSYPRDENDFAGRFVYDLVEKVRSRGMEVDVVRPGAFTAFGERGGVVESFRRRPWRAPRVLWSMRKALVTAGRDADVVHAHWLASALVAPAAGKPVVLTLHGSGSAGRFEDLQVMARWPRVAGALLRRARIVIAVSEPLAEAARRAGAADVRWIPNGVEVPAEVGEEAKPPEILFVGRLSPEKGIRELVEAMRGMNLVVAGDGPLRSLVPNALGFVSHKHVERLLGRAAVVVIPSHREGLPMVLLEAMAHGRPVVASRVGGIPSMVEDGHTGILVEPGNPAALRAAIERLLDDPDSRRRLGEAGREKVAELCSWDRVVDDTLAAYEDALR